MSNLTVAVIGPEGYAAELGKKGTSSDITFYNLKKGENTITFLEPTRYPERLAALFFSVSLASRAILVVDEVTASFGECVIMLDCAGIREGILVLRNYITPEQIAPLIRGTVVEQYRSVPDDRMKIREQLIAEVEAMREPENITKNGAVPVDHFFNVKGIGVVVLGEVVGGRIVRHENLRIHPTKKTALVRSIQKHDDDAEYAIPGDRVGLALKGIEAEDLDRGYVLSASPEMTSSTMINGRASLVRYWPSPLKEGMVLHAGLWMQFIPARLAFVDNSGDWRKPVVTLRTETELVYQPGARILLHYLDGGKLRVAGTMILE
ncbi:MAG: elongation factor Tu [Methanoregulaceae archaeon]|jgi:selenocysteine-specific translation elongation factor|nr:elongation factor Tu [Methanoregulaceae archaeon]